MTTGEKIICLQAINGLRESLYAIYTAFESADEEEKVRDIIARMRHDTEILEYKV